MACYPTLAKLALATALAIFGSVATAPPLRAASYLLNFTSFSGNTGALRVELSGSTAISASGTIDGFTITGLSSYAGSDQQLFVGGPVFFTVPGLSFVANNGVAYNLTAYPDNANRITNSISDPGGFGTPIPSALTSITVSAVPIPASISLLLLALGMLGVGLRGRRSGSAGLLPA